jgi:hypothetical protein
MLKPEVQMLRAQDEEEKNPLEKLGEAFGNFWSDMHPPEDQGVRQEEAEPVVRHSGPPPPPPRNSHFSLPGRTANPHVEDTSGLQDSVASEQESHNESNDKTENTVRDEKGIPNEEDEPPPLLPPPPPPRAGPPPPPPPPPPSLPLSHGYSAPGISYEVSPSPPPRRRPGKPFIANSNDSRPAEHEPTEKATLDTNDVKPAATASASDDASTLRMPVMIAAKQEANAREAILLKSLSEIEASAAAEMDAINEEWGVKLNEHISRNAKLRVEIRQANRRTAELEHIVERLKTELEQTASVASNALLYELPLKASAGLPQRSSPAPGLDVSVQVNASDLPIAPTPKVQEQATNASSSPTSGPAEEEEEEEAGEGPSIRLPELESLNAGFDSGRSLAELPRPMPSESPTAPQDVVVHPMDSPTRTRSFSAKKEDKRMTNELIEVLNSGYDSFDRRGGLPQAAQRESSRSRLSSVSFANSKAPKPSRWNSFSILNRVRSKSRSLRTLEVGADDRA